MELLKDVLRSTLYTAVAVKRAIKSGKDEVEDETLCRTPSGVFAVFYSRPETGEYTGVRFIDANDTAKWVKAGNVELISQGPLPSQRDSESAGARRGGEPLSD